MTPEEIHLGMKVVDRYSGFHGIVIGKAEFLSGRVDVMVQPLAHQNQYVEGHWFDSFRILEVKQEAKNGKE